MKKRLFCMLMLSLMSLSLHAKPAFSAEEFNTFYTSLRLLWGLLIVLAVILIIYFFLRKRFSLFQQHGKGIINVLEVKHVMPKKTLMLVEVRGKEFLVGCGNDGINTITPLSASSSFSELLDKSEEKLLQS